MSVGFDEGAGEDDGEGGEEEEGEWGRGKRYGSVLGLLDYMVIG